MSNPFKNSLSVSSEYSRDLRERIKQILAINEKYYTRRYRDLYKKHFLDEFLELKMAFPEIDFDYSGRFKSKESMTEKVYRKIREEHKSGNIYDNFANKIIIYSVNGNTDEDILRNACIEISNFLVTYHSEISSEYFEELRDKRKDYITNPKENGYQAIHLIRRHKNNSEPEFLSETQIRTFRMEEHQKFGSSSHANSYKKGKAITLSRCPIFLRISKSKEGVYKVYELSPEKSLEEYLNYTEHCSDFTRN